MAKDFSLVFAGTKMRATSATYVGGLVVTSSLTVDPYALRRAFAPAVIVPPTAAKTNVPVFGTSAAERRASSPAPVPAGTLPGSSIRSSVQVTVGGTTI